jgi:hypothetical protein
VIAECWIRSALDGYDGALRQLTQDAVTPAQMQAAWAWAVANLHTAALLETIRIMSPEVADRMAVWLTEITEDEDAAAVMSRWQQDVADGEAPSQIKPWEALERRPWRAGG